MMKYKLLGRSGLRVAEIALGTMGFGTEWGWGADYETSKAIFESYAGRGGNFIDTANRYTEGTSEKYVGEFVHHERDYFVLATKYTFFDVKKDINGAGNHRKNLVRSVEGSLRRLNTGYIDLLWIHAWDFSTPVDEIMRALDDLVRMGKILHVGVSNTHAWIVAQANTLAQMRGWTPFTALQVEYSLIQRTPERELLPMARAFDIAVTPWAPLGGGTLTGKYLRDEKGRLKEDNPRLGEKNIPIVREVVAVAKETGHTAAQVALSWLRQHDQNIIPIVGATKVSQLEEDLGGLDLVLTPEQQQRLDIISRIDPGYPDAFINSDLIKNLSTGGMGDHLLNNR
jgi:aryl-alcohol dehydrogenase-like predicted oxidoreductase